MNSAKKCARGDNGKCAAVSAATSCPIAYAETGAKVKEIGIYKGS
jgi:hypothetical protein